MRTNANIQYVHSLIQGILLQSDRLGSTLVAHGHGTLNVVERVGLFDLCGQLVTIWVDVDELWPVAQSLEENPNQRNNGLLEEHAKVLVGRILMG